MSKVTVKIFLPIYDLEGDEVEVDTDKLFSDKEWEEEKQKMLKNFERNYEKSPRLNETFKRRFGISYSADFGKGKYADNRTNRLKGRVGRTYDKGAGLRNAIHKVIMNRNINMRDDEKIKNLISRQAPPFAVNREERFSRRIWTQREIEYLRENRSTHTARSIGEKLFRSESSVSHKSRRLGLSRRSKK